VGVGLHTNTAALIDLNSDPLLDAKQYLNSYISDDDSIGQFFQTTINSTYHDTDSFIHTFSNTQDSIHLSLNIQSLNSKYESLKSFVSRLQNSGIYPDTIILQETWDIKYPTQLMLPGYQNIIYRSRLDTRGGGVGIYIREGLNFKERQDLEDYKQKTFENIVLEILYPNKSIIISNIYRSPNPPPNSSMADNK
jgi:hypothetical protein